MYVSGKIWCQMQTLCIITDKYCKFQKNLLIKKKKSEHFDVYVQPLGKNIDLKF